jgi:hypothetical protein
VAVITAVALFPNYGYGAAAFRTTRGGYMFDERE